MDKRKRIITILIFLILIIAVVFGVYWFVSRRAAQKNGTPPATFRQFLGFDTKTSPATGETGGELSSGFTPPDQSTSTPGDNTSGTTASQFTNETLSPEGVSGSSTGAGSAGSGSAGSGLNGSTSTGSSSGSGIGTGINGGSGTNGSNGTTTEAAAASGGTTAPSCTDADVNITFTPDELARLQVLQDRFYTVAQTLHTDADAATELANHDDFVLKQQKLDELLTYCTAAAQKITNPVYKTKVPTPFWYELGDVRLSENIPVSVDPSNPANGFVANASGNVPLGYLGQPGQIGGLTESTHDSDAVANGLRSIEQVLRLNLW